MAFRRVGTFGTAGTRGAEFEHDDRLSLRNRLPNRNGVG